MAATRGGIRVVIEAVDRVTAPIRRIGAGMRGMLRGLELEKVREQIGRVTTGLIDVAKAASAMALKMVAAGTAAAGALAAITRSVATTIDEQTRAARAVDVSLQSYQQLGHAAALVGSDADTMGAALGSLRDKALEAARGNQELRRAFRLMGVQIQDSRGRMREPVAIFRDVADAFARVPPSARRTEAAVRLFTGAAIGILPVLDQGSAGLDRASEDAERLGLVMSDAGQRGLAGFGRAMRRVSAAVTGVRNAIAERLAPILMPLIDQFADWIAANRELIATRVEQYIRAIPAVIEELRTEAKRLWETLRPVVTLFGEWAERIGPLHLAAGTLFLLLGGGGLIASIAKLGAVIAGPAIKAFVSLAARIVTGTGLMKAFSAVLLANPIGAVTLAVTLLAGAAYLIYRNWDEIVDFFKGIWDGITAVWNSEQVQMLRDVVATIFAAAAGLIMRAWEPIRSFFEGLWAGVVSAFEWAWDKLRPIVEQITRAARAMEGLGTGSDPQRQQQRRENLGGRGAAGGYYDSPAIDPDTGEEAYPNRVRRRGSSGPPVPRIPNSAQRVDAGGRIDIRVTQDGRVGEVRARPNDPRIEFDATADTGLYMGALG